MAAETLGTRLTKRIGELSLFPAEVARLAKTTEATISNWCADKVRAEHVKAAQLFSIADAVQMDPKELLLGAPGNSSRIQEPLAPFDAPSQLLQPEALTVAFQLAAEVSDLLREQGLSLPPPRLAELTELAYELILEGLPRAKVLRFVRAAAA